MQQKIRATVAPTALPEAPQKALAADQAAMAAFNALAASHRKEYADWVGEAKKPETGARRAARAVAMILAR